MKKSLFAVLMLFSITLSAQMKVTEKIIGKVTTSTNSPVEFVEIILINKDSVAVKSELTNENGDFAVEVQTGSYKLQIRQAKKILFSKSIELTNHLDMGIIIVENVNQLETITVVSKKKLVERKVDRLVFNVENSINASGSDALEALKVTPGVKVQNDQISMIGKSNLSVMIDDKIVQLSEEDLANYLKSIPSDAIKSIEVITTPPAKYEASGNSGLVNIKLKKAKKDSWNALVGVTYLQKKYSDETVMGNFNYNKNKLSLSSSVNYTNGAKYVNQDDYAYFADGLWYTISPFKAKYSRRNGKLSLDYQINPKWTIGTQFLINSNSRLTTDSPYLPVSDYDNGQIIRYLKSDGKIELKPNIKSLNFYNEFKIDSLGRKITLNLDYFNFNNVDVKSYNGISVIENPYSQKYFAGINTNNQDITNLSGKLDLDFSTKWATLSFGTKISNSKATNDISAFNSGIVDNPVQEEPLSQNKFEYTENVEALYFSGNKKINEHWETQFGLRMEATQVKTFAANLNQSTKNDYLKLFPTVYLSYVPNDNSTYTFSYSKRIERPRFYDLNPNIYFLNPFQTIEGNPFLQPAFIDNTELTYTYKKIESKLYFSYEDNLFSQIPIADPDTNFIRFTNENYINTKRFGFSENYTFDKFKWWTSSNAFDLSYAISQSTLPIVQGQKGFNSRISTSNDLILNSNKTILFNLSYWYSFPVIDGIYHRNAMNSLSLTIQYFLLNKDLKISLKGNDIFRTEKDNISSTVNGVYQEGKYYYDTQSIQLNVSYKFGNKKIKIEKRATGNEEERIRTGN
ncbi:outer membrane beta-barrel protein [Flavobacterium sp.]|uniref:outer membrane beta-barrel protein n=1 Tax=Flavobacterium sp. TaxID=239 RepID=UPI003D0AA4B0